jgi:hypothetical protein
MTIRDAASVLLLTTVLVGCGDDDPVQPDDGITIDDLVGSWIATSNSYVNNADAAETFEMIAAGGEVRFTLLSNGGARTWVEFGTFLDEWDSAISVDGATLVSDPVEAGRPTRTWAFTLVGSTLTMTSTDSEWDFSLSDAPPVSATQVLVFVPN